MFARLPVTELFQNCYNISVLFLWFLCSLELCSTTVLLYNWYLFKINIYEEPAVKHIYISVIRRVTENSNTHSLQSCSLARFSIADVTLYLLSVLLNCYYQYTFCIVPTHISTRHYQKHTKRTKIKHMGKCRNIWTQRY